MLKKTILFIGGGKEAIPGIKCAKKIGYTTVISDQSSWAPAKNYADYFIKASTYDHNETVKKAVFFNQKIKKINGVMSLSADVPFTVASVAKKLRLKSISLKTAKIFSNKYLMKKKFKKLGILIPKFHLIKNLNDLVNKIDKYKTSIIKPVDSRGARGVFVIEKNNLKNLFKNSIKYSLSKKLILEEFLEGPQLSTETIILKGKAFTVGVSDRNYEFLKRFKPNIIENGSDMPSKFQKKYLNKINNLMQKISINLGIENATLKGDLVIHKNKLFVIEVAARLSGGYFSSHMIPASSGTNLLKVAIKMNMQENITINDINLENKNYVSQRFLFFNPGKIKSIKIPKWIKKSNNVILFENNLKKNYNIKKVTNHTDRVGQVIVKAQKKSDAVKIATKICREISISTF